MNSTQIYIEAFKQIVPFRIKFKSESLVQKIIAFLVRWYIPGYLTKYTTVIGRSIYLPNRDLLEHPNVRFTIAHEVIHLLDQKRLSVPIFVLLYLSPQIFALGILSFPWLNYQACWFLVFALPWPSPGRFYLEARAYGFERYLYERCGYQIGPLHFVDIFQSPAYYFMSWFKRHSAYWLNYFHNKARQGTDPVFNTVLDIFDSCESMNRN